MIICFDNDEDFHQYMVMVIVLTIVWVIKLTDVIIMNMLVINMSVMFLIYHI